MGYQTDEFEQLNDARSPAEEIARHRDHIVEVAENIIASAQMAMENAFEKADLEHKRLEQLKLVHTYPVAEPETAEAAPETELDAEAIREEVRRLAA
jgi:hypothetical protein